LTVLSKVKAYRHFHLFLLTGVVYVCFFFHLGTIPLLDPDEARYTETSRNMLRTGDFVVPQFAGENRLQKPTLFYWLQAAMLSVVPDEEYAARLPSALGATAIVVLVYWFGCRRWGELHGRVSAFGVAIFPLTIALSRIASTDMTLAAWVTASALWFLTAFRESRPGFLIAAYASLGAALLTKGPVAFLFVIPALIPVLLSPRRRGTIAVRYHLLGILVMAIVLAPWLVLVSHRVPGIWSYWFIDETIARVFTGVKHREMGWWFYIPATFASTFPVSLCFFRKSLWKHAFHAWRNGRLSMENRALILWVLMSLIFFSISHSQLISYAMPILPPIALLVASLWYDGNRGSSKKSTPILPPRLRRTLTVTIALVVIFFMGPPADYIGRTKSAKELVLAANLAALPDDFTIISYKYGRYSSLVYYTKRKVYLCDTEQAVAWMRKDSPVIMVCPIEKWEQFPFRQGLILLTSRLNWCAVANRQASERLHLSIFGPVTPTSSVRPTLGPNSSRMFVSG